VIRQLLFCLLTAAPLAAELSLSVVRDGAETPISSQVQLTPTPVGDTLDTSFRVRNTGKSNAPVTILAISGADLIITNRPDLPTTLAPAASLDFTVRFQPSMAAAYSAVLKSDGVQVFVLATGVPVAKLYLEENGSRRPLDTATGLDFGAVERVTQVTRRLVLVNETSQRLTSALSIAGTMFQLGPDTNAVVQLDPLNAAYIDVVYAPVAAGPQLGELRIDTRRFPLRGTTLEPPLPKPIVKIDLKGEAPASARQPVASVVFSPVPRTSGTGKLRLDFHPSVQAADDPAILFLTTASRSIDFSVIEGEPNAQFGPTIAIPLQTGTTAGTIVATAELGGNVESASIEIPPQPVAIDDVQMTRTPSSIELAISGYDNTRSIAGATFTFLRKDGTVLAPGPLQQDLSAAFKDYFGGSTPGGSFQLKLNFPVTGGTASIESVRVVITNAVGETSWPAVQ
jgi:hypothetical protein